MKDFKEYAKNATPQETMNKAQSVAEEYADDAQTAEELTRKIASAYNGMSNMDMLKNILSEAEKSKRAGTLSNEEIENFYQTFSPMLDSGQRKKLRAIVEKLKQI